MHHWQLQEAKAQFSKLIKFADTEGPQQVTVHGEPKVVVLSQREYERLTKKPKESFVDFMLKSPLRGSGLKIKRDKSLCRDIDL